MPGLHGGEAVFESGDAAEAGVHLGAQGADLIAEFIDGVLGEAQGFFETLDTAVVGGWWDVVGSTCHVPGC